MLNFLGLKVKNFGSFGHAGTEIDLTMGLVLVQGKNGSGKSTIITDALTFVLYGKPFKKIKLPQLINNINGRECVVELTFMVSDSGSLYKIVRGMKPAIFEIYKDGVLITQEAATRDYQAFLEHEILKVSYRAFTQILVMGSAQYTPFMHLSPANRRLFVDELLDLQVLSLMSRIVKTRIQDADRSMIESTTRLASLKSEAESKKSLLAASIKHANDRRGQMDASVGEIEQALAEARAVSAVWEARYAEASASLKGLAPDLYGISYEVKSKASQINKLRTEVEAISNLENCPTCYQGVGDSHKHAINDKLQLLVEAAEAELDILKAKEAQCKLDSAEYDEKVRRVSDAKSEMTLKSFRVRELEMQLEQTKLQTSRHDEYSAQDIDRLRDSVKETVAVAMETLERRDAMSTKLKYLNASKDLLQDSGIKSRIVKSYLPIINKHVNEILSKLDLYVEFSLDENFSETILQRGRDDMSYNSLSEGEKRRVDLAILYAFRQLCVMKASGGISLVVLDEMDSGLDFEGRAQFVDLVRDMSPNAWVISHAIRGSGLEPMFDKIVGVHKIGNFTVISED